MLVGIASAADTLHAAVFPAPSESTEETLLIFWCIRPATSDEYASPPFPNRSAINWRIEVLSRRSFETWFGAKGPATMAGTRGPVVSNATPLGLRYFTGSGGTWSKKPPCSSYVTINTVRAHRFGSLENHV